MLEATICNLYATRKSAAEVAAYFRADLTKQFNVGEEVYPGAPGLVIVEDEGSRVVRSMTWGFPLRLSSMKPGSKPKPVNNIADLTSFMWRFIAPRPGNRCLIPVTEFAEADGPKGGKTRTWFSVTDQPIFAWAGMWKDSDEWGPVYSGLMTDANEAVSPVHDRMPVILHADEQDAWLHGSIDDVIAFQHRSFPNELIAMNRTQDPWIRRSSSAPSLL
ncbi:SOS response-associated peptidase [Sphingomonas koreensis]|uniref:SOS response-associated peptidase n=1 Tax=Sphingomonas koreensis TaxID=93064 RepID=UPI001F186BF6|nr:SOS response-associated peptidase family protein [Sphingomonas koreensis]